jgi:hypothetical protein
MRDEDRERLMKLLDTGTYLGGLYDEINHDAVHYADDPIQAFTARCLEMQAAALGAIAMLLARRDDEILDAWEQY